MLYWLLHSNQAASPQVTQNILGVMETCIIWTQSAFFFFFCLPSLAIPSHLLSYFSFTFYSSLALLKTETLFQISSCCQEARHFSSAYWGMTFLEGYEYTVCAALHVLAVEHTGAKPLFCDETVKMPGGLICTVESEWMERDFRGCKARALSIKLHWRHLCSFNVPWMCLWDMWLL